MYLHELVYMKKWIHMLTRRRRYRLALRGQTDESWKMRKQCGIWSPAWPQKINVSSYRKKLKKSKAKGAVLLGPGDSWATRNAASQCR